MTDEQQKDDLHDYLILGRDALLWKLDGLSEYDVRRPLVPSGTNLLGLLKHVGSVAAGYFGECFGPPFPEPICPGSPTTLRTNADMWATPEESREYIVDLYARAWAHADATIEALPLDATADVPWWGEATRHPTLHLLLIHMATETFRHAGHADIVRELIDGAVGWRDGNSNLPDLDGAGWSDYRAQLESAAQQFRDARVWIVSRDEARSRRPHSGRQPLDRPSVSTSPVPHPVVQPVGAALPELHLVGDEAVTTPELRDRDISASRVLLAQLAIPLAEHLAGGDHLALPRGPGAEPAAVWTRVEVVG